MIRILRTRTKIQLRKSGNHGDSFCYKFKQSTVSTIDTKGLDEELAEAVDKDFYENYKMWKTDHPNATTRQQVNLLLRYKSDLKFSDPPLGGELECSSRGHGDTKGSC